MTSHNWYDQEPYLERVTCVYPALHQFECDCPQERYNIPLIIEKAKEEERERLNALFMVNGSINDEWSGNNPHQQVDNE